MKWRKHGLVFKPSGRRGWNESHAATPFNLAIGGGRHRIYFTTRDEHHRSHVGFVEFDPEAPRELLRISDRPVLGPGALGYFDDHGAWGMSLVEVDGRLLMYYVGWNPGPPPLFYPSIGLATSADGGETFQRESCAPIMARSEFDPWMVSGPFVLRDGGNWHMWYISGLGWVEQDGSPSSRYHVKYARSWNGTDWERDGTVALGLAPGETNIARPYVRPTDSGYEAWYCYERGAGYRIGYATSADGEHFNRLDKQSGIEPSASGWDSEAVAYPCVFSEKGRDYLLYNGNGFGRDGFGLAVRE